MSPSISNHDAGLGALFIAFAGVMGVGKSTLARALASQLHGLSFIEPEAESWPVPDGEKWQDHVMRLECWVHDTNLSLFQQASRAAKDGVTAVADGGFFVLAKEYMDDPACQFYYGLFSSDEMQQLRETARVDWLAAPCPDVLVLVEADKESWRLLLQKRGRAMDADPAFIESYHEQQRAIRAAAERYTQEKGIKLVYFQNKLSPPDHSAEILAEEIFKLCR